MNRLRDWTQAQRRIRKREGRNYGCKGSRELDLVKARCCDFLLAAFVFFCMLTCANKGIQWVPSEDP